MILHIFPYEKFTYDYVERINRLFGPENHMFFVYGSRSDDAIRKVKAENVVMESEIGKIFENKYFLVKNICRADKIIIHSLFLNTVYFAILVLLQPIFGKKYFWNIWGADLYNAYWNKQKSRREFLRVYFIKRLPAVGYIKGDYDFLKAHYQTNAKFYLASYTYDFFEPQVQRLKKDIEQTVNILLGNSATPECQYEKAIDMLVPYKNKNISVRCVLSYPEQNEGYRNHIIQYGKEKLGDKFIPLVGFMPYEEYTTMLAEIDIAIFNHNRQQALGNIASLLYLGKRVFINPDNACKEYFEDMGAIVFSTESLTEKDIIKKDATALANHNKKIIDLFFSDEAFKERWEKIFASEK